MDTIFINFENSKTSDPHGLLLNLSDKREVAKRKLVKQKLFYSNRH